MAELETADYAVGQVVKLDRGFPLVRMPDGSEMRCEHATSLVKNAQNRCVIGDNVRVMLSGDHDMGIVMSIEPRSRELVRKDPAERAVAQVLAANFDRVIIAQPLIEVNMKRLERELVLAHQTGADVSIVLTKADLAGALASAEEVVSAVRDFAGDIEVIVISEKDDEGVEAVRALMPAGTMTVLMGRSGVGKSSLINLLVGEQVQKTSSVREGDGKGRHTTVSREIVEIPGCGSVVDMPGVRGLGVWEAEEGIQAAFSDVEEIAGQCRFRDCTHRNEPGCAVRKAVKAGELSQDRLDSYLSLTQEVDEMRGRKEQARRAAGTKTSDEKAGKAHGRRRGRGKHQANRG